MVLARAMISAKEPFFGGPVGSGTLSFGIRTVRFRVDGAGFAGGDGFFVSGFRDVVDCGSGAFAGMGDFVSVRAVLGASLVRSSEALRLNPTEETFAEAAGGLAIAGLGLLVFAGRVMGVGVRDGVVTPLRRSSRYCILLVNV